MISQTHYLDLDSDLENYKIIKFLIVQEVRSISAVKVEYWTNVNQTMKHLKRNQSTRSIPIVADDVHSSKHMHLLS